MNVCFSCPACDAPAAVDLGASLRLAMCPTAIIACISRPAEPALPHCVICGNCELYKKKDFPHWLGMSILMGACLLSVLTYWLYEPVVDLGDSDRLRRVRRAPLPVGRRRHGLLPLPRALSRFEAAAAHQPFEITLANAIARNGCGTHAWRKQGADMNRVAHKLRPDLTCQRFKVAAWPLQRSRLG